jgi:hypothetical protein
VRRKQVGEWLRVIVVIAVMIFAVWAALMHLHPAAGVLMTFTKVPFWVMRGVMHHRIRKRVETKVAAELRDGRLWRCYECDFDLRESSTTCPECGAPHSAGAVEVDLAKIAWACGGCSAQSWLRNGPGAIVRADLGSQVRKLG